ncbi:Centromere protein Scm3 N-terminal [Penicillium concentricum]|uniref:Centromere protein Scm3 N-terminal n=1 Tax=Penicillium concentricum TaxID=293559 RepID=A0A9W9S4G2_9EURO|nr:Centromere protein Scm3 N-terminal [Penicillium concentricum]KAJ5371856.1 Centromere protein Scm3 N-terminal [Penicillium concentricum]
MNPDSMDHSMQDDIQRPAKRPCLSYTPDDEEVPAEFDLPAARAQNDSRLKSLFEGIFAKYSQDFTGVGDEIDLQTGDIVVDNGHLLGMRAEDDAGDHPRSWLSQAELDRSEDPDADDDNNTRGEEDEFFSMASSPGGRSPDAPREESPSKQLQTDMDTSLDFVFTFKASGTAGLSPTTKEEHASHPTNTIPASKPQDPIWAVPDLPPSFSTPTTETRKSNVGFSPPVRSSSPPGSGSVWAVRKPRRPRTETKPKATPSKRRPAAKRKYHSSPVTHDWSFAAVPDGNESDDPLQDYEPSPTPSKVRIIRGKRHIPTKENDGPSTPSKRPNFVIEVDDRVSDRFSDPVNVPFSDSVDDPVDPVGDPVDDQDDYEIDDQEAGRETADQHHEVSGAHLEEGCYAPNNQIGEVPEPCLEEWGCEVSHQDAGVLEEQEQLQGGCGANDGENEAAGSKYENEVTFDHMVHGDSTPKATPSTHALSPQPMEFTPSKRRPITPDEAKLIVCIMYKQEKKASDVMHMLPGREYQTVWHWFYNHWTRRLANPPPLSAAWTQPELAALSRLSTQSDLTWGQIQSRFKGRSRHEVEFELLRAFVGEGFTSTMIGTMEEPPEPEEQQQEEETDGEIKDEPESDAAVEEVKDEAGDSNAASEDTAQEELELVIQEMTEATDSKVSAPNSFLGIFINSK